MNRRERLANQITATHHRNKNKSKTAATGTQSWIERFKNEFAKRTKKYQFSPNEAYDEEDIKDLTAYAQAGGIDYSTDNQWVQGNVFHVGSPYRKEVSPDDSSGTYQSCSWHFDDQGRVILDDSHYADSVEIGNQTLSEWAATKEPVPKTIPNPEQAANSVYHDIGANY